MGRDPDEARTRQSRKCEWDCARADTAWSTSICPATSIRFGMTESWRKWQAMVKQFLKSTGDRGVPQGSPLSPLVANLALDDLDHALDRGGDTITYARYLDDSAPRRRGKGAVMAT